MSYVTRFKISYKSPTGEMKELDCVGSYTVDDEMLIATHYPDAPSHYTSDPFDMYESKRKHIPMQHIEDIDEDDVRV